MASRSVWMLAVSVAGPGLVTPRLAGACAVCIGGEGKALMAFVWTAALMSALPLLLIGGIAFWIHRERRRRAVPPRATAPQESPVSTRSRA